MYDRFAARLRGEAAAERPPFSQDLHERILARVRADAVSDVVTRPRPRQWRIAALAAGVLLAAATFVLYREFLADSTAPLHPPLAEAPIPLEPLAPPDANADTAAPPEFEVAGIIAARLWPPSLAVRLPIGTVTQPDTSVAVISESKDVPASLLATLGVPVDRARDALAGALPPEFAYLASIARPSDRTSRVR
jgi:hypothetical protein